MEVQLQTEFEALSARNVELQVQHTLLNQRLLPLQALEKQVINDEEAGVKAVLMEEIDVNILSAQLKRTMQEVWPSIKERMSAVLKQPYEVFRQGFVAQSEKDLMVQLERANLDKAMLLQKVQKLEEQVQLIPAKMQICDEMQLLEAPSISAATVGPDSEKIVPAVLQILPVPVASAIQQPEISDQGIRESEFNFFEILHRAVPGVESVAAEIEVNLTEAA